MTHYKAPAPIYTCTCPVFRGIVRKNDSKPDSSKNIAERQFEPIPFCKHIYATMRMSNDPRAVAPPLGDIRDLSTLDEKILKIWYISDMEPKKKRPRKRV